LSRDFFLYNRLIDNFVVSGKKADLYDRTNPDWAPSQKLGYNSFSSQSDVRYECLKRRKEMKQHAEPAEVPMSLQAMETDSLTLSTNKTLDLDTSGSGCKFYLKGGLRNSVTVGEDEMARLKEGNSSLKEKLAAGSGDVTPESFKDNIKCKYYTGLIYVTLVSLFEYLEDYISQTSRSNLSKFQKVVLVLMKLRLNLGVQDLAYRFNVSAGCVSKIFSDTIHVMYVRMKPLILWPGREELQKSMPMEFRKHFGVKVSIIIDCFEIFIERPSNLLARGVTTNITILLNI